jgi:hypothetical protein
MDTINSILADYLRSVFQNIFADKKTIKAPEDMFLSIVTSAKTLNIMSLFLDKKNIIEITKLVRNIRNVLSNPDNKRKYRKIKRMLDEIECHIKPDTTIHGIIQKIFDLYNIVNEMCIYQECYDKGLRKFHEKHAYQNILIKYGKDNDEKYKSSDQDSFIASLNKATENLTRLDDVTSKAEKATAASEKANADATANINAAVAAALAKNSSSSSVSSSVSSSASSYNKKKFNNVEELDAQNKKNDTSASKMVNMYDNEPIRQIIISTLNDCRNIAKQKKAELENKAKSEKKVIKDVRNSVDTYYIYLLMVHVGEMDIEEDNEYEMLITIFDELLTYMVDIEIQVGDTSYKGSFGLIIPVILRAATFTVGIIGLSELTETNIDSVRFKMSSTLYYMCANLKKEPEYDPYEDYLSKSNNSITDAGFTKEWKKSTYNEELEQSIQYSVWASDILKQYTDNRFTPMATIIQIYDQNIYHAITNSNNQTPTTITFTVTSTKVTSSNGETPIMADTSADKDLVIKECDKVIKKYNSVTSLPLIKKLIESKNP